MELDKIVELIRKASDYYYNSVPIMSDLEFDLLRDHVEKNSPNHPVLKEIGAPIKANQKKVKLPYFMPSADKVKPDSLNKWLNKFNGPYVISSKLDGVSALLTVSNNSKKLFSRGNGEIGQDISNLIPNIENIKNVNPGNIVVRGELIISDDDFNNHFKNSKANARNMVSGLVTSKTIQKEEMKYMHFVVYEVIEPKLKPFDQLKYAKEKGFEVVDNEIKDTIDLEFASNTLVDWRKNSKYMIDGIIITDNNIYKRENKNPKHMVAFKMVLDDQKRESEVIGVTWNTSKHGLKKPVVQIKPVNIGGVIVKNISGQNGKFILSNKIGKGALIEVVRRGDVIPYIEKIIRPAKQADMPQEEYTWTDTNVDIVVTKDNESQIQESLAFFKGIDVDGLGIGNIRKFNKEGYKSIPQILNMSFDDILKIEGFKEKSAKRIHDSLTEYTKENFRNVPLSKIMGLSGSFGRGLGERKNKEVLKMYPNLLKDELTEEELYEKILKVPGFSTKTAKQYSKNMKKFKEFAKESKIDIKRTNNNTINTKIDKSNPLFEKKFVFTGGKVTDLEEYIIKNGGEISNSVTSKTFAVITKDIETESTKSKKAEALGIPVYSVDEFRNLFLS